MAVIHSVDEFVRRVTPGTTFYTFHFNCRQPELGILEFVLCDLQPAAWPSRSPVATVEERFADGSVRERKANIADLTNLFHGVCLTREDAEAVRDERLSPDSYWRRQVYAFIEFMREEDEVEEGDE